jgi:hypothetical protein
MNKRQFKFSSSSIGSWVLGAAAGAGLMYVMDPDRGRRRRAGLRLKARRSGRLFRAGVELTSQDLKHRYEGSCLG